MYSGDDGVYTDDVRNDDKAALTVQQKETWSKSGGGGVQETTHILGKTAIQEANGSIEG